MFAQGVFSITYTLPRGHVVYFPKSPHAYLQLPEGILGLPRTVLVAGQGMHVDLC